MSKQKNRRIAITLSPEATKILDALMAEDLQTNQSGFFVRLLADEQKRRVMDRAKRPVGRPKKEAEDDDWEKEPKIFDHPDTFMNAGRKIGRTELITYYKMRNETIPPEVQKLLDENE